MREYKFRCYSEQDKIMYQPLALEVIAQLGHNFSDNIKIMQYTGLKDKNGVEAYHKDIGIDKFNKKVIIEWNENHLCYGLLTIDDIVKDEWNFCLKDLVEIIGNIYENKEELA